MKYIFSILLCFLLGNEILLSQGAGYKPGNAISVTKIVPSTCVVGEVAIVTTTTVANPMGTYFCTQPDVWQKMTYTLLKNFENLQNNVFSDILTITIPNNGLSALIQVDIEGSLGAGGAVGEFESTTGRVIYIAVTRVININSDATMTVSVNAADAHVIGGAGVTLGTQLGPLTGAANATQTIKIQARVVRGGGTSNNHSLAIRSQILRGITGGVQIS
jgi:hypothetical protein